MSGDNLLVHAALWLCENAYSLSLPYHSIAMRKGKNDVLVRGVVVVGGEESRVKVAHVSCRLLVLRVSGEDVVDVLGEGNGVVGTREEIRVVGGWLWRNRLLEWRWRVRWE